MGWKQNFKIVLFVLSVLNLKSFVRCRIPLGSCRIFLNENVKLRPNIFFSIGSHKIELKLNEADNFVTLFEDQEVEVQCNTRFENPVNNENNIKVKCSSHNTLCFDRGCYSETTFECSPQQWNLYETMQNFAWCPKNTSSYLLARPAESEATKLKYLAGVCYDTHNVAFKSLYFTISSTYSEHLHPKVLATFYTPSLELQHLKETFASRNVLEGDYNNQDFKDWIKFANYNYSSIVQNSLLLNEFNDQLGSLLDLAWWPNLRLGNWKRYETALENQVENQKISYDILAGVSKVSAAPIIQACQTNFTLKNLIDNKNNKIPLYVWNYLRSTANSSDEIVIIGVNSPFYEFYTESDIVFCKDKCKEVPWLKKVSSTFRYSTMGVMFCCGTEDVKLSKRLDGFPDINITDAVDVTANPISKEEE